MICLAGCLPAAAGNLALASGAYAGTLGAGAATGADRSAFGGNPAALAPGRFGLRFDCHRPYALEDLQVAEAGLFADAARFGTGLDWRTTGIEGLWREQGFRISTAARLFQATGLPGRMDAGAAWVAWRQDWQEREPAWSATPAAGLIWTPWPRIKAGAFWSGRFPAGTDGERILQFGFEARCRARGEEKVGQALRLDFRKTGGSIWRALASLSIRPHPACEFTGGLASQPFQASAGCALAWRGFRVRQALRYHRYLGRTWLSGADWESGKVPILRSRAIQPGLPP